jgi:hypothetical protein
VTGVSTLHSLLHSPLHSPLHSWPQSHPRAVLLGHWIGKMK